MCFVTNQTPMKILIFFFISLSINLDFISGNTNKQELNKRLSRDVGQFRTFSLPPDKNHFQPIESVIFDVLINSPIFTTVFHTGIVQYDAIVIARSITEDGLKGFDISVVQAAMNAVVNDMQFTNLDSNSSNYAWIIANAITRILNYYNIAYNVEGNIIANNMIHKIEILLGMISVNQEAPVVYNTEQPNNPDIDKTADESQNKSIHFQDSIVNATIVPIVIQPSPVTNLPHETESELKNILAYELTKSLEMSTLFCKGSNSDIFETLKTSLSDFGPTLSLDAATSATNTFAGMSQAQICSQYGNIISNIITNIILRDGNLKSVEPLDIVKKLAINSRKFIQPLPQSSKNSDFDKITSLLPSVGKTTMPSYPLEFSATTILQSDITESTPNYPFKSFKTHSSTDIKFNNSSKVLLSIEMTPKPSNHGSRISSETVEYLPTSTNTSIPIRNYSHDNVYTNKTTLLSSINAGGARNSTVQPRRLKNAPLPTRNPVRTYEKLSFITEHSRLTTEAPTTASQFTDKKFTDTDILGHHIVTSFTDAIQPTTAEPLNKDGTVVTDDPIQLSKYFIDQITAVNPFSNSNKDKLSTSNTNITKSSTSDSKKSAISSRNTSRPKQLSAILPKPDIKFESSVELRPSFNPTTNPCITSESKHKTLRNSEVSEKVSIISNHAINYMKSPNFNGQEMCKKLNEMAKYVSIEPIHQNHCTREAVIDYLLHVVREITSKI